MFGLRELVADIDDDYLVGLSNKGIVKRAYKDLEGASPMVTWEEESASVTLGEESCQIRMPLGESSCSCPSRSICRHVVSAILWLKAQGGAGNVGVGEKEGVRDAIEGKGIETEEKIKEEQNVETGKEVTERESAEGKSVETEKEVTEGKSVRYGPAIIRAKT